MGPLRLTVAALSSRLKEDGSGAQACTGLANTAAAVAEQANRLAKRFATPARLGN
ncbi:MAG: hypothetical protein AAF722_17990 [Cyanobacteria bacterium P01_C01_bin.70]